MPEMRRCGIAGQEYAKRKRFTVVLGRIFIWLEWRVVVWHAQGKERNRSCAEGFFHSMVDGDCDRVLVGCRRSCLSLYQVFNLLIDNRMMVARVVAGDFRQDLQD